MGAGGLRMRLSDYLGTFSVADLRELASRRGIVISQTALRGRQTLVQTLAAALGGYDSISTALMRLNEAELAAVRYLIHGNTTPTLQGLSRHLHAESEVAVGLLESLRLWGLAFPEGDWQHIVIPGATRAAANYFPSMLAPARGAGPDEAPIRLEPPPVEMAAGIECRPRPASFHWDQAEFMARAARSRLKLTQAGRINKRDLKAMEAAFAIEVPGYSMFLSQMLAALRMLAVFEERFLTVFPGADFWFAQPETERAAESLVVWTRLPGYAENAREDPAEVEYVPRTCFGQRSWLVELARAFPAGSAVRVGSLSNRLAWSAPLALKQWDATSDTGVSVQRMVRSMFWLGLLAVDDAARPEHAQVTPLGARVLGGDAGDPPPPVPEELRFFLQPNAEVFAPPNLSPRTLFHLRRITGEKKGGPAGMYPVSADSVRRALDTGVSAAEIITFLEKFSRTGLPSNVRALVETAARQQGRIRLVPAEYVIVADDPRLMEEIRSLKTIAPLLRGAVTERAAVVAEADVPVLTRQLRQRGYAPLDEADVGDPVPLPVDPDAAPPPHAVGDTAGFRRVVELDWSAVESGVEEPLAGGPQEYGRREIKTIFQEASVRRLAVEIEYGAASSGDTTVRTVMPYHVTGHGVEGFCCLRQDVRYFVLSRIRWARLTGEVFQFDNV